MKPYTKEYILKELSAGLLVEGRAVEFKQAWEQAHGKNISSIGNTNSIGWLIIGVNDKGALLNNSLEKLKKQQGKIESHIRTYLKPSSAVQNISIEAIKNKKCILIEIIDPGHPVSWNNKFYKRMGAQTEEMSPGEKKALELKRPGLDFSNFKYKGKIDSSLVLDFANFLPESNGDWTALSADKILSKLDIKNKNVSGILFGDFTFRLVHYKSEDEPLDQKEETGLYRLLQDSFIEHLQSWTRSKALFLRPGSLSAVKEQPYPDLVLREVLVNAVAHSAFEKQHREIKVELYKNRIRISNHCSSEAKDFINKKFSKEHFSHNPFLMKILRAAKFSDDLGTGKNKIFKIMIESGQREPVFEYQTKSNDYGVLSVTLYNEQPDKNFLALLERFKNMYRDNTDKYKLSAALVLWRDKPLKEILSYMDAYHKTLTLNLLKESSSAFLTIPKKEPSGEKILKILLKRWVKNQLEGKESKVFSKPEEDEFKTALQEYAYKDNRKGFMTNKEARLLFGLSMDSQSEAVQLSKLFQRWMKEDFLEKGAKRGSWKVKRRPTLDSSAMVAAALQSIEDSQKDQ